MSVFTAGNLKRKSVLHDDDVGYTVQGLCDLHAVSNCIALACPMSAISS
jgi:hypothetical protein